MDEIIFPLFFKCLSKAHFDELNADAAALISSERYQVPLVDIEGKYWFIVNSEVSSLVDVAKCVPFDSIQFPSNNL